MTVRPLYFDVPNSFEDKIGKVRNIGWPVASYRVTLPRSVTVSGYQLNPFEKVVLELLHVLGNIDISTIAQETSIPDGMVRSVVLKLRDQGLIDENNSVLNSQSENFLLSHVETYSTAIVFRELVGGNVLPFVHSLNKNSALETRDLRLDRVIGQSREYLHVGPPSTREVLTAIEVMKRRARAHNKALSVPLVEQIRVNKRPEHHHLACSIFIGKHDADFRILDPFGIGFSQVLETSFARRLEDDERIQDWMATWHKSLLNRSKISRGDSRSVDMLVVDGEIEAYSKLIKALTPAAGAAFRSSSSIYASLEWALFYSCAANEPETAIDTLSHIPNDSYSEFLASAARRIGFSMPQRNFRLLSKGKFTDFLKQKAEMETVLVISLIQADSNPQHRLREVAQLFPDFIQLIDALKHHRSRQGHGNSSETIEDTELISDQMMRAVIGTLLPAVHFDAKQNPIEMGAQADLRLQARSHLIELLGYEVFGRIGLSARSSLMNAEKFLCESNDDDDARSFVSDLYSALQAVIRKLVNESTLSEAPTSNLIEAAQKRAIQCHMGALPVSLQTVSLRRVKSALAGDDPTLGALVLAMILRVDPLVLERVAIDQEDFLSCIDDVIQRRGHANESVFMSKSECLYLRNRIMNIVKTLTAINR
jgi:hypothetical protein